MPRWTKRVKIQPGTGIEGSLDDKYNWRKYGQKDILGAKYPRYQCYSSHVFVIDNYYDQLQQSYRLVFHVIGDTIDALIDMHKVV